MRFVTVVYHSEMGSWWADSPDSGLETFVAGGGSLDETRRVAGEGLEFHLGDRVTLTEVFEDGTQVEAQLPLLSVSIDAGGLDRKDDTATLPAVVSLGIAPTRPIQARGAAPLETAAKVA